MRVLTLPAYSPELNPVEKLWDQIKDVLCTRAFESLDELRAVITSWLERFWADAQRAFSLIGRGWLLAGANASSATVIPMLYDSWYQLERCSSLIPFKVASH